MNENDVAPTSTRKRRVQRINYIELASGNAFADNDDDDDDNTSNHVNGNVNGSAMPPTKATTSATSSKRSRAATSRRARSTTGSRSSASLGATLGSASTASLASATSGTADVATAVGTRFGHARPLTDRAQQVTLANCIAGSVRACSLVRVFVLQARRNATRARSLCCRLFFARDLCNSNNIVRVGYRPISLSQRARRWRRRFAATVLLWHCLRRWTSRAHVCRASCASDSAAASEQPTCSSARRAARACTSTACRTGIDTATPTHWHLRR